MNSLLFLIRRTLKNIIKSAFRKPAVLIGYIVLILFFGAAIVGSFLMPSGLVRQSSPELFQAITVLVFAFLYYTALKLGIDKGSSYFRLADVNLVFTAPLSPNKVLLYGFIKQLGGTILLIALAMFQIPNLKNNFVMLPYGIPMLILSVAAYALIYPLIAMIVYSWSSKSGKRKVIAKRILDAGALLAALIFLLDLTKTGDFGGSLINIFGSRIAQCIPIIGWTGVIASSAVVGINLSFIISASGMLILFVGLSILLYRMNLDYYEDVLEATEFAEAALKAKREGKNMMFNQKVKQNVKQKLTGIGAKAVFAKQMLEIRKTSFLLFLDRMSVTVMISAIAFKYIMPQEVQSSGLLLVLCFSVYMLLLMQIQGRWSNELQKHYIFLIPASPFEKLFYSTLAEHIKNLFDGSILFSLSGALFGADIPAVIVCIITYVSFGAVFTYSEVLTRRIFGSIHSKGLFFVIKIISTILILIPGIAAAVFIGGLMHSELIAIAALGGWSLILAITLFIFSASIFNNLEAAA